MTLKSSSRRPRFLALWLPHWPAERARRAALASGAPAPPDAPLAVTATVRSARRLIGVDREAANAGLAVGMMLTEARALAPSLTAVEADQDGDAAALRALALWCRRYAPATAPRPPSAILIDITGAAHLFGGEEALVDDLLDRLAGFGFTATAAIADLGAAALALARAHRRFVSQAGRMHADLAELPVRMLGLDPEAQARLAVMGLRRIGDLVRLGRAKLRPRLAPDLLAMLDEALGWRASPLSPIAEPVPVRAFRRFAEPIERLEDVEACLNGLARKLARELETRVEGARRLALTLFRVDGVARALPLATAAPLRDEARIVRLFRDRLARLEGGLEPGFGFDLIALEALATEPLAPVQTSAIAGGQSASAVAPLIDRLAGRLGMRAVRRLAPRASHIPERAVLLEPATAIDGRPDWSGEPWSGSPRDARTGAPLARPLALLPAPEPIEAVAEVPDGPPLRFTWRRVAHRVVAADGPERIAGEWWRERAPTRDYYRVEDEHGARFWVYRSGLYERETAAPRWYLHGLFP